MNELETNFLKNTAELSKLSGAARKSYFRKLSLKWHPDKHTSASNKAKFTRYFQRLSDGNYANFKRYPPGGEEWYKKNQENMENLQERSRRARQEAHEKREKYEKWKRENPHGEYENSLRKVAKNWVNYLDTAIKFWYAITTVLATISAVMHMLERAKSAYRKQEKANSQSIPPETARKLNMFRAALKKLSPSRPTKAAVIAVVSFAVQVISTNKAMAWLQQPMLKVLKTVVEGIVRALVLMRKRGFEEYSAALAVPEILTVLLVLITPILTAFFVRAKVSRVTSKIAGLMQARLRRLIVPDLPSKASVEAAAATKAAGKMSEISLGLVVHPYKHPRR